MLLEDLIWASVCSVVSTTEFDTTSDPREKCSATTQAKSGSAKATATARFASANGRKTLAKVGPFAVRSNVRDDAHHAHRVAASGRCRCPSRC